jgi:hypothetical protein
MIQMCNCGILHASPCVFERQKMEKSASNVLHSPSQKKEIGHTIFDRSKQRFFSAVKWNVLEAVLYHVAYFCHQLALYNFLGTAEYGKIGSLLAFSFLCVPLLMGALDMALIPSIQNFTQSRENFYQLIKRYLIPQCLFILGTPLFLLLIKQTQLIKITAQFSWSHCIFVGFFIACEAIKKLLRRVLQLLFYNRYTAAVEVTVISIYVSLFWAAYFLGVSPSIYLVILPFLSGTIPAICFFMFLFYRHAMTLKQTDAHSINTTESLRKTQLYAFINQLSRSLFSSNLLVPLFALWAGFMEAGVASLANSTTYTFTYFLHKICSPAAAFFGHTRSLSSKEQNNAFMLSIKLFCWIVSIALIFLSFYGWIHFTHLSTNAILYTSFFFFVHILEHLFTLYEKFFTSQNQGMFLLGCNIISCVSAVFIFWALHTNYFLSAILISFSLRVLLLIGLSCIIFSPKNVPILSYFYSKRMKTTT